MQQNKAYGCVKHIIRYSKGTSYLGLIYRFRGNKTEQVTVALSPTEAEYIDMSNAFNETIYLKSLADRIGICRTEPILLGIYNHATIPHPYEAY